ncbi:MAG TPA: ankyrin repeat domain-containing protein [Candidatus Diapherotrites archaeon]|uniref:Ankyrin repeat domain-containing protein n=1 Tax=Candidatus Iainarchaeum sp. TaxID=3101447 RepID=A0A7J4IY66_9ARCH|nr:ankyrin repeat domain-containing protein [Candidatus Diapherotrites archaeon]
MPVERTQVKNELFDCEARNDTKKILELLKDQEILDDRDEYGRTILMYASLKGWPDVVREIIQRGEILDTQDKNGYSALHFAAQAYKPQEARLLLEAGAAVDLQDKYGKTPLSIAVLRYKVGNDVISLLIKFGADKNKKNKAGISSVDLAGQIGCKI